ncbi:MAG: diguanylate cyclase [Planctomycetes bacterium DG_58]|nr:MAG: diguanylate cyclase [Planctomycetes bacterium DG_58]
MVEKISPEIVEAIFETLPVEVTFVDEKDTVQFFNKGMNRIFPRPEAILGRKVQNCHPEASLHAVNRILDEFKSGARKEAIFWIDHKGRKVYIRYFPVLSKDGEYLGCIEVTQDITDIQKVQGQKRLLDE